MVGGISDRCVGSTDTVVVGVRCFSNLAGACHKFKPSLIRKANKTHHNHPKNINISQRAIPCSHMRTFESSVPVPSPTVHVSNGPPGWQIVLSSRLGCLHCVLAAGGEVKAGAGAETSVEYSG